MAKISIDRQTLARIFGDPQAVRAMEALFEAASGAPGTGETVTITGGSINGVTIGTGEPGIGIFTELHGDTLTISSSAEVLNLHAQYSTSLTGINSVAHGGTGLSSNPTNGQLDIGNGSGFTRTNLTAGAGVTISNAPGSITIAASGGAASVPRNYISGFRLANDTTTPATVLSIAAGQAADSANAVTITGTAFRKSIGGVWVAGTGNAGMGNALTAAANTWYHVFSIVAGGAYDVYFDTSITAANKPASATATRYVGSFLTDGSAAIVAFSQVGQFVYWTTQRQDLTGGTASTPTLFTVSAPPGINTAPILSAGISNGSGAMELYVWTPLSPAAPAPIASSSASGVISTSNSSILTNTARQLYYRTNSSLTAATIFTSGYINPLAAMN